MTRSQWAAYVSACGAVFLAASVFNLMTFGWRTGLVTFVALGIVQGLCSYVTYCVAARQTKIDQRRKVARK